VKVTYTKSYLYTLSICIPRL